MPITYKPGKEVPPPTIISIPAEIMGLFVNTLTRIRMVLNEQLNQDINDTGEPSESDTSTKSE